MEIRKNGINLIPLPGKYCLAVAISGGKARVFYYYEDDKKHLKDFGNSKKKNA